MNPRIDCLLNRWIDGELTPPEAEAVQRMLIEDAEARQACYELLMVDRLLGEKFEVSTVHNDTKDWVTVESAIRPSRFRLRFAPFAAFAAAAVLAIFFLGLFSADPKTPDTDTGPLITASTDSRITIAQRQDRGSWAVGELLRLERGTADIRLERHVTANFQGPAAMELLDHNGGVRLVEGIASVAIAPGSRASKILVPGGALRSPEAKYIAEVLPDGDTNIRVESGFLEVLPQGMTLDFYLKSGDSVCLAADGTHRAIRLPHFRFRSGVPEQLALFRDDFQTSDHTALAGRIPPVGEPWEVLSEANPTLIRKRRLDTSSGARRIVANLADHSRQGPRAVYVFSFDLLPPDWLFDKVKRRDGVEQITVQDEAGNNIVSLVAKAANGHRWQLADERNKAVTALTPVSALWTHSLTLCYGLDGWVTLHDGATAQSPIIAELHVETPPHAAKILIENFDGGDLAFDKIETLLLTSPTRDNL